MQDAGKVQLDRKLEGEAGDTGCSYYDYDFHLIRFAQLACTIRHIAFIHEKAHISLTAESVTMGAAGWRF